MTVMMPAEEMTGSSVLNVASMQLCSWLVHASICSFRHLQIMNVSAEEARIECDT